MMANQMYSLKWNNYSTSVSKAFQTLRNSYDLVDVTLTCEGKKIPAHKVLLSACSNYFKDLFTGNPCQHPIIVFQNVTYASLIAVVDFIYKGEVSVEDNLLASFLTTAELLEVEGLTNHQESVDPNKVVIEKRPHHSKNLLETVRASSSATIIENMPPLSKKRKKSSRDGKEIEPARVSTVPESEATNNDSMSFEIVSVKEEAPDYENMVQLEEFGSDPIGIDPVENSAEINEENLEMIHSSQNQDMGDNQPTSFKNCLKFEEYRNFFTTSESHALNDTKPLKAKCLLCDGEKEISYSNRTSFNLKRHMETYHSHLAKTKNATSNGGKRRRPVPDKVPSVF